MYTYIYIRTETQNEHTQVIRHACKRLTDHKLTQNVLTTLVNNTYTCTTTQTRKHYQTAGNKNNAN